MNYLWNGVKEVENLWQKEQQQRFTASNITLIRNCKVKAQSNNLFNHQFLQLKPLVGMHHHKIARKKQGLT
jgi:hypothetical protein